jgi:hypothetical protein
MVFGEFLNWVKVVKIFYYLFCNLGWIFGYFGTISIQLKLRQFLVARCDASRVIWSNSGRV